MTRLLPRRSARVSAIFLMAIAWICFLLPVLGLDPYAIDPDQLYAGPSAAHWLGTDGTGRDFLARLLVGGRISLTVGVTTAALVLLIGSVLGIAAGYYGGWVDRVVMRLIEMNLSVPKIPLMLLFAALDLGRLIPYPEAGSVLGVVLVVGLFGWTTAARLARAATLKTKELAFIEAAVALGLPDRRIILRHVLPAAVPPLIVATTLAVGDVILYESVLSFLGLGVRPPVPSWGAMLSGGLLDLSRAPLLIVLPGLLTLLVVAAFQVVGDGLRDALDVRTSLSDR